MEYGEPVTMADDGTFRCALEFRARGANYVAENEFEVDDGLIARLVGQVEFAQADG